MHYLMDARKGWLEILSEEELTEVSEFQRWPIVATAEAPEDLWRLQDELTKQAIHRIRRRERAGLLRLLPRTPTQ